MSTTDKTVSINNIPVPKAVRKMILNVEAYQRKKEHSTRYGDRESYSEIIIRLLDYYEEKNNERFLF